MPKIIVKCRYYKTENTRRNLGGLLEYIAKREGVRKCDDGWKNAPPTAAQRGVIEKLLKNAQSVKQTDEYTEYEKYPTRGNASELIASALEAHPSFLDDKTYLDYIATRPRAERIGGTHGLFSDDGTVLDLADEVRKLRAYNGNVYSAIISVKREDAERLGYNRAEEWRDMIRAQKEVLAKSHNIPLDKLRWYGAFHNEAHHPHVHLMLYSEDKTEQGYLSNKGIELMRKTFGSEIFRADIRELYDKQTVQRNLLIEEAREEFDALADGLKFDLVYNSDIVRKLKDLALRMQNVKGKKVYGYLPKDVKRMVDELVDELEKDETVKRMYDLWYEAKCAVENTYTDHFSPQLPLSQENVFKPIRNAVVKRANELGKILMRVENTSSDEKTKQSSPAAEQAQDDGMVATAVIRLGKDISDTFRQRYDECAHDPAMKVDRKLLREIQAKKRGQRLTM